MSSRFYVLSLPEQQYCQLFQRPTHPLIGGGRFNIQVIGDIIGSIAAVAVLSSEKRLKDVIVIIGKFRSGGFELLHVFHRLAVPLF